VPSPRDERKVEAPTAETPVLAGSR